jgi:FkbM family methyltransferase
MTSVKTAVSRAAIRLATGVYRATPFQPLREMYFNGFLRLVRHQRVVRTVEGMTFELDLGEMIDACLFLGQFERDIVALIERLTPPGGTVIDIGANVGAHTLRFAKHVGASGRVLAIEPTDYAYRKLVRNLSLNVFPQVTAMQLALADRPSPGQTISFRSSWRSDGRQHTASTVVDFVTLDDCCASEGIQQVDVMKLDVDGHEFGVLAGGRRMLNRSRPALLMETGAWHFEDPGRNPLVILRDLGYRFWDTKTLEPFADVDTIQRRLPQDTQISINVLAMTEAPAWLR